MSFSLPPIVKAAERLLLEIEQAVRRFPRYHKYTHGTRLREQATIDSNKVSGLPAGSAYIISHGRAMKANGLRAPDLSAELPPADHTPGNKVSGESGAAKPNSTVAGPMDGLAF